MSAHYTHAGLAISFSPFTKALLKEAKRIIEIFSCKLSLIHVGESTKEKDLRFRGLLEETGIPAGSVSIVYLEGSPARAILEYCDTAGVDLLISGALEKEKALKYYFGSVARTLMREARSSVFILREPEEEPVPFKKIFVAVTYTAECERAVAKAYHIAEAENAERFVVIHDSYIPGLSMISWGTGSLKDTETAKEAWLKEQQEKLRLFLCEFQFRKIPVETHVFYGREDWEAANFARSEQADLFVIAGPAKKLTFIDRIFQHDIEHILNQLPTNLLIVRKC